jgi:hypothetical protein
MGGAAVAAKKLPTLTHRETAPSRRVATA